MARLGPVRQGEAGKASHGSFRYVGFRRVRRGCFGRVVSRWVGAVQGRQVRVRSVRFGLGALRFGAAGGSGYCAFGLGPLRPGEVSPGRHGVFRRGKSWKGWAGVAVQVWAGLGKAGSVLASQCRHG